jgi:hypothetical protein
MDRRLCYEIGGVETRATDQVQRLARFLVDQAPPAWGNAGGWGLQSLKSDLRILISELQADQHFTERTRERARS